MEMFVALESLGLFTLVLSLLYWLWRNKGFARIQEWLITSGNANAQRWLGGVLDEVDRAVTTAVKEIAQTYVDDIKAAAADGMLTQEEKTEALNRAKKRSLQLLSVTSKAVLEDLFGTAKGEATAWLDSLIEAKVHDLKTMTDTEIVLTREGA